MALQVGGSCYATVVDAGAAACAEYNQAGFMDATNIYTTTCTSANATTGVLNLSVITTKISTNVSTVKALTVSPAYPPCNEPAHLAAYETIFGGVLALFAICYGGYKVISFLGYSRGSHD
jgi:hypothetical protein